MSKGDGRRPEDPDKEPGAFERGFDQIEWGGYLYSPRRGVVIVDADATPEQCERVQKNCRAWFDGWMAER